MDDLESISEMLFDLRAEHRDLDDKIRELSANPAHQLEAMRLKKKKLRLKDEISKLEALLHPDIIA